MLDALPMFTFLTCYAIAAFKLAINHHDRKRARTMINKPGPYRLTYRAGYGQLALFIGICKPDGTRIIGRPANSQRWTTICHIDQLISATPLNRK